jgi:hypothetical protein
MYVEQVEPIQSDDLCIVIEDENSVDDIINSKADTINKANFLFSNTLSQK